MNPPCAFNTANGKAYDCSQPAAEGSPFCHKHLKHYEPCACGGIKKRHSDYCRGCKARPRKIYKPGVPPRTPQFKYRVLDGYVPACGWKELVRRGRESWDNVQELLKRQPEEE